jgi:signal transduction histidine kinase/PAS domain-containing protein
MTPELVEPPRESPVVVSGEKATGPRSLRPRAVFRWALFPLLIVAIALGLSLLLQSIVRMTVFPIFLVAVVASSVVGELAGGVVGLVLACLAYLWFFIPPAYTLLIPNLSDAADLIEFLASGALIVTLMTKLQRSRREARARHAFLEEVLRQMPAGVMIAEAPSGRLVLVNAEATEIRQETDGSWRNLRDGVLASGSHPDGSAVAPGDWPIVRAFQRGEVIRAEEITVRRRDGSRATLRTSAAPIRDNQSRIVGAVSSFQNVTDQKRAAVRQAAQYAVSSILSNSADLSTAAPRLLEALSGSMGGDLAQLWLVDANTQAVHCVESWWRSETGGESFGRASRQAPLSRGSGVPGRVWATGRSHWVTDVVEDDNFPRRSAAAESGLRCAVGFPLLVGGEVLGVVEILSREARPLDEELLRTMGAIGSQVGQYVERKRAEAEVRELNATLEGRVRERTEELEAALRELDEFAYTVAHDLRAPLRAISGFSDLLMEDYAGKPLDEHGREMAHRISQAGRRMDSLIMSLLEYSRLSREPIEVGTVDLDKCLTAALVAVSPDIASRRAEVIVERPLGHVLGNASLLEKSLKHLLANALKFTPRDQTPRIRVRTEKTEKVVRLSVSDRGIGIDPKYRERIFGIFQRLNRSEDSPGIGIGLPVVRRSVERMGGRVGVEAEPGGGSRFWMELRVVSSGGAEETESVGQPG